MEKIGIIKAVSDKGDGKHSFKLDDSEVWYSGFTMNGAVKGDKISFNHEVNGTWNNFKDIKVIEVIKPQITPEQEGKIPYSMRELSIVSQCLTKLVFRNTSSETTSLPSAILDTYEWFIKNLQ